MKNVAAFLPVVALTIEQLQFIEFLRSESYIKAVNYGWTSDGVCHLTITDDRGAISSCKIDDKGKYI